MCVDDDACVQEHFVPQVAVSQRMLSHIDAFLSLPFSTKFPNVFISQGNKSPTFTLTFLDPEGRVFKQTMAIE